MSQRNPSGAVHPTVFLFTWFLVGVALHLLWPLDLPGAALLEPLKFVLGLIGLVLFGASAFELRRNGTTMEHKDETTALVTGGPYRISRNPIYVALVLFLVAIAVHSGSAWFLMLTFGFWAAVQWLTVAKEEAYLEQEFGEDYLRYKSTVRPWL